MDYVFEDFRNARTLLRAKPAWSELETAIHSMAASDILDKHRELSSVRAAASKKPPAGGQTAVNAVVEDLMSGHPGWVSQPKLFRSKELKKWTMDFLKDRIGVEVSFNHAEAIPWQFTRLNIAGESERVVESSRIDVGVVICATAGFKRWARMDSSVGTFDAFAAWLREMRPILPVPLFLIGLVADEWGPANPEFRGTSVGTRTRMEMAPDASEDQDFN